MTQPSPAAPVSPPIPLPLTLHINLTLDDTAEATLAAAHPEMARNRRHMLTRGLTVVLAAFIVIMGLSSGFSPAVFLHVVWGTPLLYLLLCMAPIILLWALHPRLAMRGMRTMLRDGGVREAWAATLQITEEGITSTEPDRTTFVPWHRFRSVEETPRLVVCALWPYESTILPKAAIPADIAPALISWMAARIAAPAAGAAPELPPAPETAVRVTHSLTPDDYAEALTWQRDQPAARRRTRRHYMLFWVLGSLLLPIFILLLVLTDPRPMEWERITFLAERMVPDLLRNTLVLGVATFGFYLFRRRMAARAARKIATRNAAQFDAGPITTTFGPDGITIVQGGAMSRYGWPMVMALGETLSHVLVPLRSYGILAILREDLGPAARQRLLDMARAAGVPTTEA